MFLLQHKTSDDQVLSTWLCHDSRRTAFLGHNQLVLHIKQGTINNTLQTLWLVEIQFAPKIDFKPSPLSFQRSHATIGRTWHHLDLHPSILLFSLPVIPKEVKGLLAAWLVLMHVLRHYHLTTEDRKERRILDLSSFGQVSFFCKGKYLSFPLQNLPRSPPLRRFFALSQSLLCQNPIWHPDRHFTGIYEDRQLRRLLKGEL